MATFTILNNDGTIALPDASIVQETVSVYGLQGHLVTNVSVTLNNLTHTFPKDLDMLLVGPNGTNNLLFWSDIGSTAGGTANDLTNASFTISDSGNTPLPAATVPVTGTTYRPADYDAPSETDANFSASTDGINHPTSSGAATFAIFDNLAPNGTWALYIADDLGQDSGTLQSWGLTITTNSSAVVVNGAGVNDVLNVSFTSANSGSYLRNGGQQIDFLGVTSFSFDGLGLVLSGATGVGSSAAARVLTSATRLAARAMTSGGVFVSETDAVTLDTIGGVANGTVNAAYDVTAGGSITIAGDISTGSGAVTLAATGSGKIIGALDADPIDIAGRITTTGAVTLSGVQVGALAVPVLLNLGGTGTVSVTTTGAGDQGNIGLSHNATAGLKTSQITTLATAVSVQQISIEETGAGGITVDAAIGNATDRIVLAGTSITGGAGTVTGGEVWLSGTNGVGTSGARVNTAAETLQATSNTGGVFVNEADAVELVGSPFGNIAAEAFEYNLVAGGTITVSATLNDLGGFATGKTTLRASAGDIVLNAGAGNATGDTSLTSNSGAITRIAGTVSGNLVTLSAATGIGSAGGANAVFTSATTLSVSNTTSGNINVVETDGLNLAGLATLGGSGSITVTAVNGSITTSGTTSANGSGGVALTANGTESNLTVSNAISSTSGGVTLTAANNLGLNAGVTTTGAVALNAAGTTTVGFAISGMGSLVTDAAGTTAINGSSVTTAGAQTFHDAVTLGTTTNLTGTAITFDSTVNNGGFGLTVTNSGASLFSGVISGGGGFTKAGSGTTTLAATNLYAGATLINAGTLLVDGSISNSATTVNGGGTLGGTGTVDAVIVNGGTLSPGASPGILNTGDLSFAGGGSLKIEIGGTTAGDGAGHHDRVKVTGTINLTGAALNASLFDGFDPESASGATFTVIDNDLSDAVTGTFASLAEGAHFAIGGSSFSISYHGGSNSNDVMLTALNDAPVIASNGGGAAAIVSIAENVAGVTTVHATDIDSPTVTYGIGGGADAGAFQIDSQTGGLFFKIAPDFEHPADSDQNNSYIVQVRASDGGAFDDQMITVSVTNIPGLTIVGDSNDNTLTGAIENDTISGLGGNDTINGGGGTDTTIFAGLRSAYTITRGAGGAITATGPDGTDTLTSVERLQFDDQIVMTTVANDFNGDGRSDVLFDIPGPNFNSDYLWQMNDRSIASQGAIDLYDKTFNVQVTGDYDGDGKSDVVFQNPTTGGVWMWQLDGTTIASQGAVDVADPTFHLLGSADFNGDGKDDLLFRNDAGFVYLWQMDGRTDTPLPVQALDPVWHVAGAGDFDGDGRADILLHNVSATADNGAYFLWKMNGNQIIGQGGIERPDATWHTLAVADFDGDGKSDFAIRNESASGDNGAVWVYLMDGTAIRSQGAAGIVKASEFSTVGVGDYNGDGRDDILFRNAAGFFYSWDMNGKVIASEGAFGTEAGNFADPAFSVVTQHWDLV